MSTCLLFLFFQDYPLTCQEADFVLVEQWTCLSEEVHAARETGDFERAYARVQVFQSRLHSYALSTKVKYLCVDNARAKPILDSVQKAADSLTEAIEGQIMGRTDALVVADSLNALATAVILWQDTEKTAAAGSTSSMLTLFALLCLLIAVALVVVLYTLSKLRSSLYREGRAVSLTWDILEAQETERKRISFELHDTVAQDMRYVMMLAEQLVSGADGDNKAALQERFMDYQKKCIQQIRHICYNMMPPDIEQQNLFAALTMFCGNFAADTGLDCRLVVAPGTVTQPLGKVELLHCFRLVQECLNNVHKHARATEVTVLLRNDESEGMGKSLLIFVTDNGLGFDMHALQEHESESAVPHLGMRGMKERAAILQGAIEFDSVLNEGAQVRIEIPLKRKEP